MRKYSYDEIYGVDITEYCQLHKTTPQELIEKIDIDIQILKNQLERVIVKNDDDFLVSVIYTLINKKEKHKDRLMDWLKNQQE